MHYNRLGTNLLEREFAEKDVGLLVDTRLTTSQECILVARKATSLLGCIRQNIASRSRGVIFPLYSETARYTWSAGLPCTTET